MVRWLVEHFDLDCLEACGPHNETIKGLLVQGDLETADWLVCRFSLARSRVLCFYSGSLVVDLLTSRPDRLDVLELVVEAGYIPRDKMQGKFAEGVFGMVCALGHLGLAEWVFSCTAISKACLHLNLANGVPFDNRKDDYNKRDDESDGTEEDQDAQASERIERVMRACNVFEAVCEMAALDVARWLCSMISLTKQDILRHLLGASCATGKLPFVQWLVSHFAFDESDLVAGGALPNAMKAENIPLVSWLVSSFSFTEDMLRTTGLRLDVVRVLLDRHVPPPTQQPPGVECCGMAQTLWGVVLPACGLCDDPDTLARVGECFLSLRGLVSCRLVSLLGRHGAVTAACSAGALSLCKWLVHSQDMTRSDFTSDWVCGAVGSGCGVSFLEWITSRFQVTKQDLVSRVTCKSLTKACAKGREEEAKCIVQRFEIVRDGGNSLTKALRHGHIGIARWLVSVGLVSTLHEARVWNVSWLEELARRGDFEAMQLVLEHIMSPSQVEEVTDFHHLMREACLAGQTQFCKWALGYLRENLEKASVDGLWEACCESGSIDMIEWGRDNLGTEESVMTRCLPACIFSGNVNTVKWYVRQFNVPKPTSGSPIESRDEVDNRKWWCYDKLEMIQWLVDWASVSKDAILEQCVVLRASEQKGGGQVVKWLTSHFRLNCLEACGCRHKTLYNLLCHGDFEVADWLVSRFSLDRSQVLCTRAGSLVRNHWRERKLDVLCHVVDAGYISSDRMQGDFAKLVFVAACLLGHLGLAKWVFSCAGLSKYCCLHFVSSTRTLDLDSDLDDLVKMEKSGDVTSDKWMAREMIQCNVLKAVCAIAALDVAQWLAETFSVTRIELLASDLLDSRTGSCEHVIYLAFSTGNLPFVQWLVSRFSLTEADVITGGALRGAVASKSIPTISWLVSYFTFTYEVLDAILLYPLDLTLALLRRQ